MVKYFIYKESGSILVIVLFAIIFLGIIATFISIYNKNFPSSTETEQVTTRPTLSSSLPSPSPSINPSTSNVKIEENENHIRKEFNFDKINSTPFIKTYFPEYKLTFAFPPESDFEMRPDIWISGYINKNTNNPLLLGNISMTSQFGIHTELYDGMNIDFAIYDKKQESFESFVTMNIPVETRDQLKASKIPVQEDVYINNKKYQRLTHCCYGELSYSYYLESNNLILQISIYTAGPDKDKFQKVAENILSQVEFTY